MLLAVPPAPLQHVAQGIARQSQVKAATGRRGLLAAVLRFTAWGEDEPTTRPDPGWPGLDLSP
jgi:hypothetical protein